MRISRDQWAMGLAKLTSARSTCLRRAVGCVLLNARGHVLATGYNGVAAGMPHCNEQTGTVLHADEPITEQSWTPIYRHACAGHAAPSGQSLDACQAIHAEQNALLQCRDVAQIFSVYVTASPCMTCAKLLLNTGCQNIFYAEEYPHSAAKDLWLAAGRTWTQIS